MGSLLNEAMDEADKGSSKAGGDAGASEAASGGASGGSLLSQAMSTANDASDQAAAASSSPQQFQESASQLSPDEFHAAAKDALTNVPPETRAKLGQALAGLGASEGAGVQADTKEPGEIAKMVGWVHKHVPGGVPGALGIAGAAGLAGGAAYIAHENPDEVNKAKNAVGNAEASDLVDGTTAHTILNQLQSAVAGQIAKKTN